MNVPEKWRELAHAWVDGAEIEIRGAASGDWISRPRPDWDINSTYRIKPKKVKKWRWLRETEFHYTEQEARDMGCSEKIPSTMIEVDE